MAKTPRQSYPPLPLSPAFYATLFEVGRRFGLDLGDRSELSRAVLALSRTYTTQRSELASGSSGASAMLARLGFFLPRDLVKLFGPLTELSRAGRLPSPTTLRVLDLGAGLGTTSLGLARFLRAQRSAVTQLSLHVVERDAEARKLMAALCGALGPRNDEFVPMRIEAESADARRPNAKGLFHLVLAGLVLNELFVDDSPEERVRARARLLAALSDELDEHGAIVVLEPALRENTRELMRLRDVLLQQSALHVFAPCVHRAPCPMLPRERDWCHETLDYALPPELASVARAAGLRYEGLHYAALVLTRRARFAEPSELVRIVSDPQKSKGKLEFFGCSASGYQRITRLDRDASANNAAFGELRRGDIMEQGPLRIERDHAVKRR